LVILDAPSQDAIFDSLRENRLGQIQDVEVYRPTPMEEMFANGGNIEPLF
jgi:hypothetical protein